MDSFGVLRPDQLADLNMCVKRICAHRKIDVKSEDAAQIAKQVFVFYEAGHVDAQDVLTAFNVPASDG